MATVYPLVIRPGGATGVPNSGDTVAIPGGLGELGNLSFRADGSVFQWSAGATNNPGSEDPGSSFQIIPGQGAVAASSAPAGSGGHLLVSSGKGGNGAAGVGELAGPGGSLLIYAGQAGTDGGAGGADGGDVYVEGGGSSGAGVRGQLFIGTQTPTAQYGTSAIQIGRSSITTTVVGSLAQNTGTFTLAGNGASSLTTSSGTITIQPTGDLLLSANGGVADIDLAGANVIVGSNSGSLVRLGGDATCLLTINARIAADVIFAPDSVYVITVDPATIGVGGSITLAGGAAFGNSNGGNMTIRAGAKAGTGVHGILSLGATDTSAINLGASGVTTTITGGLSQLTGAVSLTANAASSFTTSAGALTLTSAAAATWKTSAGLLTIEGAAGIQLNGSAGASYLTIGVTPNDLIIQGSRRLTTTGSGNINLPNNVSARFQIEGSAVGSTVTQPNLDAVTNGTLIGNANEVGSQHNHRSNFVINSWAKSDIAASQSSASFDAFNVAALGPYLYRAVYPGDVLGITVSCSATITAGQIDVEIWINGVDSGFGISLNSGTFKVGTFATGDMPYVQDDSIELRFTTDGSWAPTTNDIVAGLVLSEYIA